MQGGVDFHFMQSLSAQNPNLVDMLAAFGRRVKKNSAIWTQFCTAQLLWHEKNYGLTGSLQSKLQQKEFLLKSFQLRAYINR